MLRNRNDLLRFWFWFRLRKSFGSGSGFRQYLAQFFDNKNFVKNLAFPISEAALFPRKLPVTFFYSISWWIRIQLRNRIWNCNAFRFRFRWGKKLRFLRFCFRLRFHNTIYRAVHSVFYRIYNKNVLYSRVFLGTYPTTLQVFLLRSGWRAVLIGTFSIIDIIRFLEKSQRMPPDQREITPVF